MKINIFWFRRDLRLNDNAGFHAALQSGNPVLPVFIFDTEILASLQRKDARVEFIHRSLQNMSRELQKSGSDILIKQGSPEAVWKELTATYDIEAVFTNHDYEPYARERDEAVSAFLSAKNISFSTYKDVVIFEKQEILNGSNLPYTVFTPYSRKWKAMLEEKGLPDYPSETLLNQSCKTPPFSFPDLESLGFSPSGLSFPEAKVTDTLLQKYNETRDFPGIAGTSRLGLHLRFGTLSIRKLVARALETNEIFLNELIWREFYMQILWNFPHVVSQAFKPEYDKIQWVWDETLFRKWCEGKTGYPLVDAGMRELNATGYMHNRVRMVVASFLCKHLLMDWRLGEAYFAEKLLDFELASNNGGWQWAAGSGCDAAPYFRVFNPELQMEKFDKQRKYIRKWIPEYGTPLYPRPVVEHVFARNRCLEAYGIALKK
ncbi:MAG: DNA photolyase family protein [Bacteroidia bacterium]|nr:DNA photolyase family protein [Bacteroidia bacterium]